jgi:hypothetical protein
MNPYLEQPDAWPDFHSAFSSHARDDLAERVGDNYFVKIEMQLYRRELPEDHLRHFGESDLGIGQIPQPRESSSPSSCVLSAPVRLTLPTVVTERHTWLEIRARDDRRLVTVLELLSPSNKAAGPDHEDYLRKRNRILRSQTHLVEIDFRRGGHRPRPPALPPCDYYALVSRTEDRPELGFWPIRLRDPLPTIPVPLAAPDPDVLLDLQTLLHRIYDRAHYNRFIYANQPEPALSSEDQEWARQFIPQPT